MWKRSKKAKETAKERFEDELFLDDRVKEDTFFDDEDDEEFGRLLDEDVEEFDALFDEEEPNKSKRGKKGKKDKKAKSAKGKRNKGSKKGKKTAAIVLGSILGVFLLVYVGFALFFNSHFMFFTKINGTDVSLKSVSAVETYMEKQVDDYVLTMKESDGGQEMIAGTDISLEYVPGEELKKLVKKQDNFLWIKSLWEHPKIQAKVGVKYDEKALEKKIGNLNCMKEENRVASVDAYPQFQTDQFQVVPEVVGTQLDNEKFHKKVAEAINGFQEEIDLLKADCYILPKFTKESPEVAAACETMNGYLGASVTYDFNPYTELVDASVISQWVKVDAEMNVTFDEAAVRAYVQTLAEKYNTKGKTRTFTTATGNTVNIEGGSYGWQIDQEAEYHTLIGNIQNAEVITREPAYASRGASHEGNDVGGTYAEVDLTAQHMYFVQNGQVVMDTPIVTGNPNKKGCATPQGVYSLAYKALDQVLRGDKKPDGSYEYETPVKYWMPFNGGIGFHDANWQPTFGGSRYLTNGSHGCVNMPPAKAGELYNLISAGTPIVCHY